MQPSLHRRPWFPWILVGVCVIVIVVLGIRITQAHHYEQKTRRILAMALRLDVSSITTNLTTLEHQLMTGQVAEAEALLWEMHIRFDDAFHEASDYQIMSGNADPMYDLFLHYHTIPNGLRSTLQRAPAQAAELLPTVVALRTDLERWDTTFTEALLAAGSADHLHAAGRLVCQDLRSAELVQQAACQTYR